MSAREGAAFVSGVGSGMVAVAASVVVFGGPPVAYLTMGLLSITLGLIIERSAGGGS